MSQSGSLDRPSRLQWKEDVRVSWPVCGLKSLPYGSSPSPKAAVLVDSPAPTQHLHMPTSCSPPRLCMPRRLLLMALLALVRKGPRN